MNEQADPWAVWQDYKWTKVTDLKVGDLLSWWGNECPIERIEQRDNQIVIYARYTKDEDLTESVYRDTAELMAKTESTLLDALHDGTFGKLLDAAQKEDGDET